MTAFKAGGFHPEGALTTPLSDTHFDLIHTLIDDFLSEKWTLLVTKFEIFFKVNPLGSAEIDKKSTLSDKLFEI